MLDKTGSTPKSTLLDKFKNVLDSDYPDIENYELYLAISGGKDSMVLSHLLLSSGMKHTLLHCNFNLRGKESDEDESFLKSYANQSGLDIKIKEFDTYKIVEETGKTIQEVARNLRYNWFSSFITNENILILTAHHLDDSIETFFINLLRGTGYKGVKGIPKFNNPYYRPLSSFSADDIYKYIDEFNIDYREDSSNRDTKYLRNKLRHDIIPNFIELENGFKSKMRSFFDEMNSLDEFVQRYIRGIKDDLLIQKNGLVSSSIEKTRDLDVLVTQLIFNPYGLKRSNIGAFMKFLQSQTGAKFFSESHVFLLDRENILIQEIDSTENDIEVVLESIPAEIHLTEKMLRFEKSADLLIKKTNNPLQFDFDKVNFPLTLRNWRHGDKIKPLGMNGLKLVSDVLIDHKVSQFEKNKTLVIVDHSNQIIGIPDLMISNDFKVDDSTQELMLLTVSGR